MPSITVSSVNTGADQLVAIAHGLVTGSRFRLRNTGGALPAATPSLAPVTDYFAILVDVDNIKVATSSANAFANTAVDITGTGTGTHFVEYGLPYCVPRIAAPGTQVFSADFNSAWTALVALYALLTAQAQSIWTGVQLLGALAVNSTITAVGLITAKAGLTADANQHVTVSGTGRFKHGTQTKVISAPGTVSTGAITWSGSQFGTAAASASLLKDVPLDIGCRVSEIRWFIIGSVSGTWQIRLEDDVGVVATGTTSTAAATNQTLVVTTTYDVVANASLLIRVLPATGSTAFTFKGVEIDYSRPN